MQVACKEAMEAQLQTCQQAMESTKQAVKELAADAAAKEMTNLAEASTAQLGQQVASLRTVMNQEVTAQVKVS